MDAAGQKRHCDSEWKAQSETMDTAGTPETLSCKRNRSVDASVTTFGIHEKWRRVGDPHLAFVADGEVVQVHTQWRNPKLKDHWDSSDASAVEGVDASISARAAEECSRVLGQERSRVLEEGKSRRIF